MSKSEVTSLLVQELIIIRSVTIGDRALIDANAVVICDVPPGATAVGILAKIIEKNQQV
ncbi:hypothetical protein [Microcoleus sp. S13_B4]|uniref:hypothetical protein n=1 Tax=Microcoleus sp. S13_B4 TaxID=3055408 RepID=UPI002FD1AFC3